MHRHRKPDRGGEKQRKDLPTARELNQRKAPKEGKGAKMKISLRPTLFGVKKTGDENRIFEVCWGLEIEKGTRFSLSSGEVKGGECKKKLYSS